MRGYQQRVSLEVNAFGGVNTAVQFSQINISQSPRMQNGYMDEEGDISKRPGTIPVTENALSSPIEKLILYKSVPSNVPMEILATSGNKLYKFENEFIEQTMTNELNQADVCTSDFTNSNLESILFIVDEGDMKQYSDGEVKNISPAADDPHPNPPNGLLDVNAKKPKYCWTYSGHVFVSPGTNEVFYSKRYEFDYFPTVQWFLLIRDNDFVNGPGIAFNNVCLIPMRRGWAILTGYNFDTFNADTFLNTANGVVAPRSIARLTSPDGVQTVAYLSDDGVHEIYDTTILDSGTRQYATRSLMKGKIDFTALGLTEQEKSEAVGFFDAEYNLYFLSFKKNNEDFTYVYDVRNREWYTDWTGFSAKSYVRDDAVYFAGDTGHLHKFDKNLYSDWDDKDQTTGSPVYFKRYSPLLFLEFSGFDAYWDYHIVEAKQWLVESNLDELVIFTNDSSESTAESAWKSSVAVYDVAQYDESAYANLLYTDTVNAPNRFIYKRKSKYIQVLWENNRDEPIKVYKERWLGRVSGE